MSGPLKLKRIPVITAVFKTMLGSVLFCGGNNFLSNNCKTSYYQNVTIYTYMISYFRAIHDKYVNTTLVVLFLYYILQILFT